VGIVPILEFYFSFQLELRKKIKTIVIAGVIVDDNVVINIVLIFMAVVNRFLKFVFLKFGHKFRKDSPEPDNMV
jgi:hypothetical protein